jgi:hypothetical protein
MAEASEYELEPLRHRADFTLYRAKDTRAFVRIFHPMAWAPDSTGRSVYLLKGHHAANN